MKVIKFFLLSIIFSTGIPAQIPGTISYQGILTDESNNPKPDGNYSITFSFYELETGGDAIWNETKTLNVNKGLFSTSLGDQIPFGAEVKFNKPYWLGLKMGDEAELIPRIALASVGYSLTSNTTLNVADGVAVKSLNGLKDDVILEGGGGTTINTNGNLITISGSGSGGTGIQGVQNTNNTLDITDPNGPTATVNLKLPLSINGNISYPDYLFTSNVSGTGGAIIGLSDFGFGIVGQGLGITGVNYGVAGNSQSPDGFAVSGWNLATAGNAVGVIGRTNSPNGIGIWGESNAGRGIYGVALGPGGSGVVGESNLGIGVTGNSNKGTGVYGSTSGVGQFSVYGKHNSSPSTYGALGYYNYILPISFEYGVYGASSGEYGLAGYFAGPVGVTGSFSVTGNKTFKIDHPLDPANKYLIHSCIESPDRMNVYNGNITTDANGFASIELPPYFESLNIDYRYQLTAIGQQAQAWIETEIQNNRFTIKTDKSNVKVSWQVTGIRNDPYAKTHPMIVEKEKEEAAKGKYLTPELYGQPKEKGINYVKNP